MQGLRSTSTHLWAPEKARLRQPLLILSPCLGTPVPATASNVAKPSDAGISEEEDTAIPMAPARMATRQTPVDETKPLVVGDWLRTRTFLRGFTTSCTTMRSMSHRRATAVTYIVSRLKIMRKYEDSTGTNHTTVGLACRRRHIFIVISDDRKGLHWFVCAMDCRVQVWAFKVHICRGTVVDSHPALSSWG